MIGTTAFSRTIRSQPGLIFSLWRLARGGRRMARVVEVDGDIVTITMANGQDRRWDMNLAQGLRVSRHGADVQFPNAGRMWIPWGAFAERDRRWMMAYIEQLQARLARRRSPSSRHGGGRNGERPVPPHD
jgi:hypothetical protein